MTSRLASNKLAIKKHFMNILVIPPTDWKRGPLPTRLHFVFERLAERHSIYVARFKYKRLEEYAPRDTSCQLCEMGGLNIWDFSTYYVVNAATHLRKLQGIVREHDIDVIVSANIMPSMLVNLVKGNTPVVLDYLDHYEESAAVYYQGSSWKSWLVKKVVRTIVKWNLGKAFSLILISPNMNEYLQREYGIIKKIDVIPNGTDTSLLYPMDRSEAKRALGIDDCFVLGFTGMLEHWIDLGSVVRELPELVKEFGRVKLLMVGDSVYADYKPNLHRIAAELDVEDCLMFTGFVPLTEMAKHVAAMDVCLNPRKDMQMNDDGISNKIIGYLACGRPILSKNGRGAEETLTHCYPYTDGRLAEKVREVIDIAPSEDSIRQEALNYDWDILTQKYEQVLFEAVNGATIQK